MSEMYSAVTAMLGVILITSTMQKALKRPWDSLQLYEG